MPPKFLGGADARRRRQGPPRGAGRVAGLARESVLRHQRRQPRLGPLLRRRASSSRSTTSASAIRPATPSCSTRWASKFTEYNYDFKQLVRDICNSRTYQRSTAARTTSNASDERNFAHATHPPHPGREPARLHQPGDRDQGQVPGPAAGRPGRADRRRQHVSTYFLTTFGRATRETVCACEVKTEPTLSQALHLLNGDTVNAKIKQGGVIPKLMAAKKLPEERIDRPLHPLPGPQADRRKSSTSSCPPWAKAPTRPRPWKTSSGPCSNSREFLFNH